jgi:GT2 family glycosyltransferase
MRPTEISVEKHLVFHKDHPNCIYGGNQLEENVRCKTDVQKFKRHLSLKWTAKYHEGLNELSKENLFLTAANFSIPKSLFEKLGGFDERLKDAEDFELGIRALDHGYNVYFDKSNIAWHDDFVTCRSYVNRQRQYQKANDVLSKRLPNEFLRKPLYFHHMNWMKRFIFYMFSNSVFVKMIDKEDFLFLPKRIRFKIYDLTVTGLGRIYTNKPLD